jgi:hypothetical protein
MTGKETSTSPTILLGMLGRLSHASRPLFIIQSYSLNKHVPILCLLKFFGIFIEVNSPPTELLGLPNLFSLNALPT